MVLPFKREVLEKASCELLDSGTKGSVFFPFLTRDPVLVLVLISPRHCCSNVFLAKASVLVLVVMVLDFSSDWLLVCSLDTLWKMFGLLLLVQVTLGSLSVGSLIEPLLCGFEAFP